MPGNACAFTVRFDPDAVGVRQARSISSGKESDGPRVIDLSGTQGVLFFGGFE